MSSKISSWADIEAKIRKEMYAAFDEAVQESFEDLKENVDYFYSIPEPTYPGHYHRTGQLGDSPQLDTVNYNGNSASAQISINTGTQYYPAGRDTETIYGYAENDGLVGRGGFWKESEYEFEENINKAFSKRFKKA